MWTATLSNTTAIANAAVFGDNIVQESDWALGTGFERATLFSIRGWISIINGDAASTNVNLCIAVQGDSEATVDCANVATYVDEDILWTGGYLFDPAEVQPAQFVIDVKAKRKLSVGQDVSLFIAPNGGAIFASFVLRGLVDKG